MYWLPSYGCIGINSRSDHMHGEFVFSDPEFSCTPLGLNFTYQIARLNGQNVEDPSILIKFPSLVHLKHLLASKTLREFDYCIISCKLKH